MIHKHMKTRMSSYMVPIKVTKLTDQQIFVKLPNIEYHENPSVVLKLLHTDGQTDTDRDRKAGRQADRQAWQSQIAKCVTVL